MYSRTENIALALLLLLVISLTGCDGGLEPKPPPLYGAIEGTIIYEGDWPSQESVKDLRFVALREVPAGIEDFLNFETMVIGPRLEYEVEQDHFLIEDVKSATYRYSGVARQFSDQLIDWEPLGLYKENGGVFTVEGDTVRLDIRVDFENLPPFPPE